MYFAISCKILNDFLQLSSANFPTNCLSLKRRIVFIVSDSQRAYILIRVLLTALLTLATLVRDIKEKYIFLFFYFIFYYACMFPMKCA